MRNEDKWLGQEQEDMIINDITICFESQKKILIGNTKQVVGELALMKVLIEGQDSNKPRWEVKGLEDEEKKNRCHSHKGV
jgi:hypothetical protein